MIGVTGTFAPAPGSPPTLAEQQKAADKRPEKATVANDGKGEHGNAELAGLIALNGE